MQINRFLHLVMAVMAVNVLAIGTTYAEIETVVVVGKKCGDGSCGTGPFYDQQPDYDPYAVPGGGGGTSAESAKVKSVMDKVDLPACRPAGQSTSEFTGDNYGRCMVQANDKDAVAYGKAAAAFAFTALSTARTERLNATPAC